jgi:prolyl 4-hydroxylase
MNPAARLAGMDGVQRVPTRELDLYIVRHFLDLATCAAMIEFIDANREPSGIANDQGIANFRTSETCYFDSADPAVAEIEHRIERLLGLPPNLGERMQGQRYAPGQEFQLHTDTFNLGSYDFYLHTQHGGQRTWTAMIYLNEPEAGGATRFKRVGKTIQPETGKLLTWNNLLPNGTPNPATLHQGMRVRRGTKYVLTKWFRERPL